MTKDKRERDMINSVEKTVIHVRAKLQVKVLEKVKKKPFLPKCPYYKTRNLHRIAVFDQRGPPARYLGGSQSSNSCKS